MLSSPSHLLHSGVRRTDKNRALYPKCVMGKRRAAWNNKREARGEFRTLTTSLLKGLHSNSARQSPEKSCASRCSCRCPCSSGALAVQWLRIWVSQTQTCLFAWFSVAYVNLPATFYEWSWLPPTRCFYTEQESKCITFQDGMAGVQTYLTEEGNNLISLSGPLIKP